MYSRGFTVLPFTGDNLVVVSTNSSICVGTPLRSCTLNNVKDCINWRYSAELYSINLAMSWLWHSMVGYYCSEDSLSISTSSLL